MRFKPKEDILGSIVEIFPGPDTEFYRQHGDGLWRKYEISSILSIMRYRPSLFLVTGVNDEDETVIGYHFATKKTVMITKVIFKVRSTIDE